MEIRSFYSDVMNVLHKAVSNDPAYGNTVRGFIKEDLEIEAHNQLWNEEDPDELVLLKLIPKTQAKQTNHKYSKLTGYGNEHSEAAFAPNGLPSVEDFSAEQDTTILKPYGQVAQVQGLAALEQSISALGQDNIVSIDRETVRRNLMYKINIDSIESDTRNTLNANKFKGIIQLIDEGTRATGASTPDSNIIVDMRGADLSLEDPTSLPGKGIRSKATQIQTRYGKLRWLLMAPNQLKKLEDTLDVKSRYMISQNPAKDKYIIGAAIDGAKTGSGTSFFAADVALQRRIMTGYANAKLIAGAPNGFAEGSSGQGTFGTPVPIASSSLPSGVISQFANIDIKDQAGAGSNQFYFGYGIVAMNEIGSSIVGYSTGVQIAAGGACSITIRPRGDEKSFKIYRGIYKTSTESDGWLFAPEFIAEIPNGTTAGNTTPIDFIDDNSTLPGTTLGLGLNIASEGADAMIRGEALASLANRAKKAQNGMSMAQLTSMFTFDLAKLQWLASYELLAWVLAPQVEKPFQHVIWKNLGRKQVVNGTY